VWVGETVCTRVSLCVRVQAICTPCNKFCLQLAA
jgi:hypothetical protein